MDTTLASGGGGSVALGFALWAVLFGLYWLPSIVAMFRWRHLPNPAGTVIINFLLGWTVVGWIVALVMAARSAPRYPQPQWQPPPYAR